MIITKSVFWVQLDTKTCETLFKKIELIAFGSTKDCVLFVKLKSPTCRQTPPTTTSPSAPLHVSPYFEQHGLEPEHRPLSGFILPLVSTKKFTTPTATPGVQQREDKNVNVHPPTFAPPSTFALPQFDTQSESNRYYN